MLTCQSWGGVGGAGGNSHMLCSGTHLQIVLDESDDAFQVVARAPAETISRRRSRINTVDCVNRGAYVEMYSKHLADASNPPLNTTV